MMQMSNQKGKMVVWMNTRWLPATIQHKVHTLNAVSESTQLTAVRAQDVLDLNEVAEILRVHPKTVRLLAQSGRIPAFRMGRLWRFSRSKIIQWIDNHGYNVATVCAA
jgi:excisionase family DNA binding protein